MRCPRCNSMILPPATSCGCAAAPAAPVPASAPASPATPTKGVVAQMIPSGNKPALIGYYLVFVALLPYVPWDKIGIEVAFGSVRRAHFAGVVAVAAVICGAIGVRRARAHPEVRGGKHAWLAIVFGVMIVTAWLCAVFGVIKY